MGTGGWGGGGVAFELYREVPISLNITDMLEAFGMSGIQHGCGRLQTLLGSAYTSPLLSISQTCWMYLR